MSGILGGIVNALGAASQGRDQANQARLQSALQQAQITRQQQQDQIASAVREREANSSLLKDRLTQAQIGDTEAQAKQRQYEFEHPKPIKPNYAPPVIGPNGEVQLINYDDPTHPVKVPGVQGKIEHAPQGPRDQMQLVQSPGPDGKPVYYRVNMTTGQKTPLDLAAVPKTGRTGSGVDATHQMAGDHYGRAKAASDALDKFGGTVASHGQIGNWLMGHNPFDDNIQNANQAGEEFATMFAPILNKGRSTHIEIEQVKKSYVPLVTDTPEQIRIKSAARADLLRQYAKYAQQNQGGAAPPAQPTDADAALATQDPGYAAWLKQQGHP